MLSRDTTAEAFEVQLSIYRAMTPEERASVGLALSAQAIRITADGIRMRHPGYRDAEVEWASRRLRLGDELFRAAYPDAPRLDP